MGLFDGCLLASDIDGTLIENEYVNPRNVEKIEHFMNEGGFFSLATGRSIGAISDVLAVIKRVSPSVVANGCIIFDYEKNETVFDVTVPREDYRIAEIVMNLPMDIGIEIHSRQNVFTLKRNRNTTLHQVYEKFTAPDTSFEEVCKYPWSKVLYICPSEEDREKLAGILSKEKTDCQFINTCAFLENETHNYYEQMPKGVSKATGLKKLCEILNINKGSLFAIGDYYNDLPMLDIADVSAATADSPEDIKNRVDFVTKSCGDGAVADFIDYLEARKLGNI